MANLEEKTLTYWRVSCAYRHPETRADRLVTVGQALESLNMITGLSDPNRPLSRHANQLRIIISSYVELQESTK